MSKDVIYSIRMTVEQRDRLRDLSQEMNKTISETINYLIDIYTNEMNLQAIESKIKSLEKRVDRLTESEIGMKLFKDKL